MRARQNRIKGIKSGSMRQILNRSTIPSSTNTSTCGFFAQKWRCARGFRNLPHTSDGRFRKCGVKPRSADQTPVSRFRDLRFCCRKSGCARRFPIFFLALPEKEGEGDSLEQTNAQTSHHRFMPNIIQPLRPICDKEKAGAACTKRIILQSVNLIEQ